jgi:hypothetical protein
MNRHGLARAVVLACGAAVLAGCGASGGYSATVTGIGSYVPQPGPDGTPLPGRVEIAYTVTDNGSQPGTPTCDIQVSYNGHILGQTSVTASAPIRPGGTDTGREPVDFSVPQGAVGNVNCR